MVPLSQFDALNDMLDPAARRLAALALTITTAVVGCSPAPHGYPSPSPSATDTGYQMPANIRYVDHWVQTPAADLMSADGTFIRRSPRPTKYESSTLTRKRVPIQASRRRTEPRKGAAAVATTFPAMR